MSKITALIQTRDKTHFALQEAVRKFNYADAADLAKRMIELVHETDKLGPLTVKFPDREEDVTFVTNGGVQCDKFWYGIDSLVRIQNADIIRKVEASQ